MRFNKKCLKWQTYLHINNTMYIECSKSKCPFTKSSKQFLIYIQGTWTLSSPNTCKKSKVFWKKVPLCFENWKPIQLKYCTEAVKTYPGFALVVVRFFFCNKNNTYYVNLTLLFFYTYFDQLAYLKIPWHTSNFPVQRFVLKIFQKLFCFDRTFVHSQIVSLFLT